MKFLELFLCLAAVALAGEYAVLANGSRLSADRHEVENGRVRLYKNNGFIELNESAVKGFEADPSAEEAAPEPQASRSAETEEKAKTNAVPVSREEASLLALADAAADKYGLPRKLVRSVIDTECSGDVRAVSNKGAIGPMQLMPATARSLGVNPHDVKQNVDGGTRYLRDLLERYNYSLWHALAAYNAGPGAVARFKGVPRYRETMNYVRKIAGTLSKAELALLASKR